MPSPEETPRGNRGEIGRSYLFLSMILLVWNTLATGASALKIPFPGSSPVLPAARITHPAQGPAGLSQETDPSDPPLTIHQKFLIGKRLDINKALKEEISDLPGISDEIASAIVAERQRIGRFRKPEDLLRIRGIKEKRLKKLLPFLGKMENN